MGRLLFVLFFTLTLSLESQTDKKKARFFTLNASGGSAWREYQGSIHDYILPGGVPQPGERPGSAYSASLNYGWIKKRSIQSIGVAHDFAKYYNNTAAQPYSYSHYFLSLNYSFFWYLDKPHKWRIGGDLELGWVLQYTRKIYSEPIKQFFPWTEPFSKRSRFSKHPAGWVGIYAGYRLFETNKFKMFVDLHGKVSSRVGYKKVGRETYPYGNSPASSYAYFYESKPHYLIVPAVQFSLMYEL